MHLLNWLELMFAATGASFVAIFRLYDIKVTPKQAAPLEAPEDAILPSTMPKTAPPQVSTSPDMLSSFCAFIRDYEGKPGALNYQLNNPGDCRPSAVGYLAKYQPVEIIDTNTDPRYPYHKGKFAKFPTYAIGWEYLINLVHFQAVSHPLWTIVDFFHHYAPSSDANDPDRYAKAAATSLGVSPMTTLGTLFG